MHSNLPSLLPSQFDSELTGAGMLAVMCEIATGSMKCANGSGTYNGSSDGFAYRPGTVFRSVDLPLLTFGTKMQPGIRIAATVQKVKHSAIVGLYISKVYAAVTNAAVQPDACFSLSNCYKNQLTSRKCPEDPVIVGREHKPTCSSFNADIPYLP